MKTIETGAVMTESQLSQQISIVDDATANEEEIKEQIEEETVNRAASEHATGFPIPIMRDDEEIQAADNAAASSEEVEEIAQESHIDKVAFKDGIITASAKEYSERGGLHG